jgi:hypothetical protein
MRQSSCRCVAKENNIAVAKVIDNRYGERLVCIYHRDQEEDYNLKCRRGEDSKIINLDNNTIYL